MPTVPSVGYFDSYQHCNAIRCNPVGLSGTTWDTDTSLTWANMNHMGPYATSREPNHLDGTSTAPIRNYYPTGANVRYLAQTELP